jgi:putative ABC transport system ATP-binding protein
MPLLAKGYFTLRENVALVTEIARDPLAPEEALPRVGLGDRLDHFPARLSGGEQQRVTIARAIAKRPSVLSCDEPTGILVPEAVQRVNQETGTTMVVITHNAAIAQIANRAIHLTGGRIASVAANAHKISPKEPVW